MAADGLTKAFNATIHARFIEMLSIKLLDTLLIDLK